MKGRAARDLGIMLAAAGGTLLAVIIYQRMGQQGRDTGVQPPATQPAMPQPAARGQAAAPSAAPAEHAPLQAIAIAAAHAALGPDGEVLAYGDFPSPAGQQIVAIQRLPTAGGGAESAGSPAGAGAASQSQAGGEEAETNADVIRVIILVPDGNNWKEAFRADQHLKNRNGYLPGAPADQVTAWHLACWKTKDSGFRLAFTPVGLPPGRKPAAVYAAWNAKRGEYDAVKEWGGTFLATSPTPGNAPIPIHP